MWDERISVVRGFADAITERNLERALELCHPDIERDEWRVEVEDLRSSHDGRVLIVMSTHMRGKGSHLPFAQRVANVWEFKDEKLWRATLYPDPAEGLRAIKAPTG
jgi:hypothetical protein